MFEIQWSLNSVYPIIRKSEFCYHIELMFCYHIELRVRVACTVPWHDAFPPVSGKICLCQIPQVTSTANARSCWVVTAQANCDLNVTTWTWSRSCQPNTLARPHICRVLSRQPFMLTWMSMKGLCGFMPTWTPRRLQDLDLSKEEDRKLLNGAYNLVVWCDVWGLADLTRTSAHHLSLKHILAGRVSYFSLHTHSDSRSLAFVEKYWRLAAKWSIMLRIWMCSAISYSALPRSHAQRKREYPGEHPDAKEDSKLGAQDSSPQWIVNMWAMIWGSNQIAPGAMDEAFASPVRYMT